MTLIIGIILVVAFVVVVFKILITDGKPSRRSTIKEHPKQDRSVPVAKNKQGYHSSKGKSKTKKSNVVGDTAAVLAGAALAHKMMKHHKHDEDKDIDDDGFDALDDEYDDFYDYDFYDDLDTQDYEGSNYEYERAAYEEEQAAYDDFIASMDMDD